MIAALLAIPGIKRALALAAAVGGAVLALWAYGAGKKREGRQEAAQEATEQALENAEVRRDVENDIRRAGDGTADVGSALDQLRRDWQRR